MKKIIASAGLVAVGAATLNAQYAPGLTRTEAAKPWSVSASLRSFYDDNFNCAPDHVPTALQAFIPQAQRSFGFELSPAVALNYPLEQTYIRLGYIYSLRYYENRPNRNTDQSHEFVGKVEHRFSEKYMVSLDDAFVYAQEPQILETIQSIPTLRRRNADVFRNRALLKGNAKLSDQAALDLGFQNIWYDYQDDLYSGLLNRVESRIYIDGSWRLQENLVGLLGYMFRDNDFTSDNVISRSATGEVVRGSDRTSYSHFVYVGARKAFTSQLSLQSRIGAEYTTYELGGHTLNPYTDTSISYTYLPGSSAELGVRHERNATDLVGIPAGDRNVTLDAQSTAVYGQVTHRISPALTGSLLGQYQYSVYHGGQFNDKADNIFLVGVNLSYKMTEHWGTEVGYNFDNLHSEIELRGFTRNRVYVGVRASY